MMVNGDYRGSNYTMSSDDEVFNVSIFSNTYLNLVPSNKKINSTRSQQRFERAAEFLQQSNSKA